MSWIAVDHDRCERDGICMAVCSRDLIVPDAEGYPVTVEGGEPDLHRVRSLPRFVPARGPDPAGRHHRRVRARRLRRGVG